MNYTYTFPDITSNIQKTSKKRKTRRIGDVRIGDSRRNISKRFDLSPAGENEETGINYYTLSIQKDFSFFDFSLSAMGIGVQKEKIQILYADLDALTKEVKSRLSQIYGEPDELEDVYLWSDTITSLFLFKSDKASLIISDTAAVLSAADKEILPEAETSEPSSLFGKIWKKYGKPVGRVSRKTYLIRACLVGIPVAALFAFTWIRPELFIGDDNIFIITFMILGTLGFISLISLAIRRISDIGLSHLYYWGIFGLLFAGQQIGGRLLHNELFATRIAGVIFFLIIIILSFIPGERRKNKYGPVPKE